ncbi:MAG: UDP-N-acetylenolpyruvoylglucosamine reductase [Pseudomonadota bacterium]|jgi:UDP-N-acetylmuramate dehydrogenase
MMMTEPRHFNPSLPTLRGQWAEHVSMAKHVSWRAGGVARRTYVPADLDDLAVMLSGLSATEPVLCVGLGSNLLVRDGGYNGTVVFLHAALNTLRVDQEQEQASMASPLIYAEAGVASPKVARFAANLGCDAAFLAGIPGTIGGALAMNAGCYGAETWSFVEKVCTIDRAGVRHERQPQAYDIGYRHVAALDSGAAEEVFAGAWFRFPAMPSTAARDSIKTLLEKRVASQPLRWPNAGSVFRNPPGDFAARLIETTGLKGLRIGGAEVSQQHANFIVNATGSATAGDIETLIATVQARVAAATGVQLIREVRIVGDAQPSSLPSGA